MLHFASEILRGIGPTETSPTSWLTFAKHLRKLPMCDFAEVLFSPHTYGEFPELDGLLPGAPSEEIQQTFNGQSGPILVVRSCRTVQMFENIAHRVTGKSLQHGLVLDYGCGWGRLMRLMFYYTDRVFGIDPWLRATDICHSCDLPNVTLCESVPHHLPFAQFRFDFIYSWSVFTHLSEAATRAALQAARERIAAGGIFLITIRPFEFWEYSRACLGADAPIDELKAQHHQNGFAFLRRPSQIGEDFGETTMSLEFLSGVARDSGWSVTPTHRVPWEPFQIVVPLIPA